LSAGTAFPSYKGIRPAYGYAYVLLGGGWRRWVRDYSEERRNAIQTAVRAGLPLLVIEDSFYTAELSGLGFRPDGWPEKQHRAILKQVRRFSNAAGQQITVLVFENGIFFGLSDRQKTPLAAFLKDPDRIRQVIAAASGQTVVLLSYSSIL